MSTPKRIREIIEFANTDACTEEEQMSAWGAVLDDAATLSLQASALGSPLTILAFDSDTRHGLRCEVQTEGGRRRWVGIDAVGVESLPEQIRGVLEAFDTWVGGSY